jgi:hypothetical protein
LVTGGVGVDRSVLRDGSDNEVLRSEQGFEQGSTKQVAVLRVMLSC